MASGLVALISILIVAGLALPAVHEAHASEAVNGAPCVVPENAAEIEETYRAKSDAALTNWELESVDVGCGGSVSATYILQEFSDGRTTFRVYLQPPQSEDPFPRDFAEQRDVSVAQSISDIMSNYVFKAVDEEFANKTASFSYGAGSHFYISAYKGFESCRSDFEVDGLRPELLSFTISNDADIETMPLIKIAREHAVEQLQNTALADAAGIKNATDSSCGQTTVRTSYSMDSRGIEPYSYSALVDVECDTTVRDDECPEQVKLVYGTTFQSPIVSSLLNGTAPDKDDNSRLQSPDQEEAGGMNAWFYSTFVPIGVGSAIAGAIAFVMFRRLKT